jgi:hypothetical protein
MMALPIQRSGVMAKRSKFQVRSDASKQRWVRDERKEAYWRARINDWKKSGKSKRAYCIDNDLPESTFNAWGREIAIRDREKVSSKSAQELLAEAPQETSNPFVPLRLLPDAETPPEENLPTAAPVNQTSLIEVLVPGGAIIRLHVSDLSSIGELYSVLKI